VFDWKYVYFVQNMEPVGTNKVKLEIVRLKLQLFLKCISAGNAKCFIE